MLLGKIISTITEYLEVKTEQLKLRIISNLIGVLSKAISIVFLTIVGLFFVLFLSLAIVHVLNEVLESTHLGFFIVSGFYLLTLVLIFILMKTKTIYGWLEIFIFRITEKEDGRDD